MIRKHPYKIILLIIAFATTGVLIYSLTHTASDEKADAVPNPNIFITHNAETQTALPQDCYASISDALASASAGDTIYVRGTAEPYTENLDFSNAEDDISLVGLTTNGIAPILDGSHIKEKNGDQPPLILIEDKKGITVDNFILQNNKGTSTNVTPIGILICGVSSDITVRNCELKDIAAYYNNTKKITQANAHGILVAGDTKTPISNVVIEKNLIHDLQLGQSEAIAVNGNVTNTSVNYNEIHHNDNIGIDFIGQEGTCPDKTLDYVRESECIGNHVYEISSEHNPSYEGDISAGGIYVDGGKHITIKDNVIEACDIGIEAASEHKNWATDSVVIDSNVIANCMGYTGISLGGYDPAETGASTHIQIKNNILYNNKTNLTIQYANIASDTPVNFISNNIFYQSDTTSGTQLNLLEGECSVLPVCATPPLNLLFDNVFNDSANVPAGLFEATNFSGEYSANVVNSEVSVSWNGQKN